MRTSIAQPKRPAGLTARHAYRFLALCLMALLLFSNLSRAISAAAGDLDPSFDGDGKVLTDFFGGLDIANAIDIQSTAKGTQVPLWKELTPDALEDLRNNQRSWVAPERFKAFQLNEAALGNILADAPLEFTEAAKDTQHEIALPMPDGAFARFRFVESPIMEPELAAQFTEIKTYRGWGIDDPTATTRFDRTSGGFHAIVLSPRGAFYIDPLSRDETRNYASYFTRDAAGDSGASCQVGPDDLSTTRPARGAALKSAPRDNLLASRSPTISNGTTLRTFRLAVAATAEYTAARGGTVASAMASIATTINNVNVIYQNELAVCFVLVNNNDSIIFTDPATDGYTSGNVNLLPDENQTRLDDLIGGSNYDIGHVFDSNAMGAAGKAPGLVCNDGEKGKGASNDLGFPFTFAETVAHEIGHQLGAQHTFNGTMGICNSNRNDDTAYEPGSGSTIMSYAESCGSDKIQFNKDPYFHSMSLVAMAEYLDQCGCASTSNTNNTPPDVTLPPTNPNLGYHIIPGQTPFALTASASDAEDADLTYCWEDRRTGSPGPPTGDRVNNPLFRSWLPTSNPTRTFPQMKDVLGGTPTTGETLPTTDRWLAFGVTVRDNHPFGGGFTWEGDVVLNVYPASGPFTVTQPTAGSHALEGSWLTVSWDVAYTDVPPVNTTHVRILLSTDNDNSNDKSFPITLAASTPNDGSFIFRVPRANTDQARIKVEAIDNVFFNVSPAFRMIPKPTIIPTNSLTATSGGPSVTASVATVADERDEAGSLVVTRTTPLPPWVTLSLTNDDGVVSATATAQCSSPSDSYLITLQVTNSAGLTATTTLVLVVNPNPSPILGNYNDATVSASQSAIVSPSVPPSDPNDNLSLVTVSPATLPGGGMLSVNQTTGVVTINTSSATQLGTHQIQVQATDSCDHTTQRDFLLNVVNSSPQITRNANSVSTTKGGSSLAPITIATVSDQQDPPGALEVSATAPVGLNVSVTNSNGTVTATAAATCLVATDSYNATLIVNDSATATTSASFPIYVGPNPPPTLGTYLNTGVTVGGSVLIVPNVPPSDPNNSVTPSVSPTVLPGGGSLAINQTNGRVTVTTVPATDLGTYPVTVTALDACGASVTKNFNLTVRSANCDTEQSSVFVADTGNHRIQRFDGANWNVIGPGTQGSGPGQFTSPESVVASPDGRRIYVADTGNNRLQWSQDGGLTWAVFASSPGLRGLVLDRDGNLYVSDAHDNRVVRYTGGVPGTPITLATGGSGPGRVSNPNGLAIDCRMNLYIADTGNNRIFVIATADAVVLANTGTLVAGPGIGLNPAQVTAPQGVAVDDGGGRLYVADTGNDRVLLISSAPAPGAATALCTLGPQLGRVRAPEGLTVAAFTVGPLAGVSSLVVSDTTNNRIQGSRLPAGSWMLLPPPAGGGPGSGIGQFMLPSKIR